MRVYVGSHVRALATAFRNADLLVIQQLLSHCSVTSHVSSRHSYLLNWVWIMAYFLRGKLLQIVTFCAVSEYRIPILFLAIRVRDAQVVDSLLGISNIKEALISDDPFVADLCYFEGQANLILVIAAEAGNLDVLQRLLSIPEVMSKIADNETKAFIEAAGQGHLDIVIRLLEIKVVYDNAHAGHGRALRSAARGNGLNLTSDSHWGVVHILLDIPAVRACAASSNNEVLILALQEGRMDIVDRLLEINEVRASANSRNNEALVCAADNGYFDVIKRLVVIPIVRANIDVRQNMAFRWAAQSGHLDIIKWLLTFSAVAASADAKNNEAIMTAASHGHMAVVQILLDIPSVSARVGICYPVVLRWAIYYDHALVVKKLLDFSVVRVYVAILPDEVIKKVADRGGSEIIYRLLKIRYQHGIQNIPQEIKAHRCQYDNEPVSIHLSKAQAGLFATTFLRRMPFSCGPEEVIGAFLNGSKS